ncbi:hypothetical protein [Streptomyces sp. NPDC055632]
MKNRPVLEPAAQATTERLTGLPPALVVLDAPRETRAAELAVGLATDTLRKALA